MPGVPSTLNELIFDETNRPLLRPFPSLKANTASQGGLAYVQSMEIDPLGRMWVLDSGSQNQVSGDFVFGPARVIIYDLTSPDPSAPLLEYTFPPPVALPNGSMTFLNDIVVDWRRNLAYISLSIDDGGVIFFDANSPPRSARMTNKFTQVTQPQYLTQSYCNLSTITLGPTPSDGIALSPDGATLLFCPLIGTELYRVPTAAFTQSTGPTVRTDQVEALLQKPGMSDGLAMTNASALFYGNNQACGLNAWETASPPTPENQPLVLQNSSLFNWVDTLAFDGQGSLLFTTNRLAFFFDGQMDFSGRSGANFRIWSWFLNVYSYMN